MVQEFQVLRCFSCQTFQVHQVKKSKKWNCKLCGEKQSLLKVYGQGSGADCRQHVQKLNLLTGEMQQASEKVVGSDWQEEIKEEYEPDEHTQEGTSSHEEGNSISRWSKYLVQNEDQEVYAKQEREDTDKEPSLSQPETPLKLRRQKERVPEDCGFEDQEQMCSTNRTKRAKMCEDKVMSISIGNQRSANLRCMDSPRFSIYKQHETCPISMQFASAKSKWGEFLSSSPATEEDEGGVCIFADTDQEECTVLKVWQKKEVNEDLKETRLPIPKTRSDGTVLSKGFSLSGLKPPSELQAADNHSLAAQTGGHCTKQLTHCSSVSLPLTTTSACTNMFQTDEDFDENY